MPLPHSAAYLFAKGDTPTPQGPRWEPDICPPEASYYTELVEGLSRKTGKSVEASWFYDDLGSALFEAITKLPEYGLTRADDRLISRCAGSVACHAGPSPFVAELGSGSGVKTRTLLSAMVAAQASPSENVYYAPIDVSAAALDDCVRTLQCTAGLTVQATVGDYLDGLALALRQRKQEQRALVLFLGSTVGNFNKDDVVPFLKGLRACLLPGDLLLLGADLVKPASMLERAYDDPTGVTASFNRNLLGHLNRSFSGDFDLNLFRHVVCYNRREQRIEMYLEATEDHQAYLEDLDLRVCLSKGERILTEYSHKFYMEELRRYADASGFEPVEEWVDREWPFVEWLWRVQ